MTSWSQAEFSRDKRKTSNPKRKLDRWPRGKVLAIADNIATVVRTLGWKARIQKPRRSQSRYIAIHKEIGRRLVHRKIRVSDHRPWTSQAARMLICYDPYNGSYKASKLKRLLEELEANILGES